jgi:outer membrane protein OmpA-like peptidoglycan-associated protein
MLNQDLDIIGTGDKNNGLVEVRLGAFLYFGGTKQEHMNVEESAAVPEPTIVSQPETPPKSTPAPSPTETAPTPAPTPESRPATPFAPGKTVIFPEITFVSGESAPDPAASKVLDQVFEILNKNPEIRLEIIGHTDSVGSEKSNQALSKKRAEFVINYLIHRGIASDRLVAGWYGEMKPIASNETAEGRSQNRRIEFIQLEK